MRTIREVLDAVPPDYPFGLPNTCDLPDNFTLPEGLSPLLFVHGLSCYGTARLLVDSLGGRTKARVYEVWFEDGEFSHAYVLPLGVSELDRALNADASDTISIKQVKILGQDITDWVFEQSWEELA